MAVYAGLSHILLRRSQPTRPLVYDDTLPLGGAGHRGPTTGIGAKSRTRQDFLSSVCYTAASARTNSACLSPCEGLPMPRMRTSDDINLLQALTPQPGEVVPWEAVEETLGISRHDRRFRTIYRAWIRHLRKWNNRKMAVPHGVGLA